MNNETKKPLYYVVRYYLNFYANPGKRYRRHAVNRVELYDEFKGGVKGEPYKIIESTRQNEIINHLKLYTTKEQRKILKEWYMEDGSEGIVLPDGTHFPQFNLNS